MKPTYKIQRLYKMYEVDNYNEGCDPNTAQFHTVDLNWSGSSPDEVIKKVQAFLNVQDDGIELNACDEIGRVDFSLMECEDSTVPNKAEMARWKKGQMKLYYCVYTATVAKITPVDLLKGKK